MAFDSATKQAIISEYATGEGDTGSEDLGTGDAEGVGRLEVPFGETKPYVGVEGMRVAWWSKSAG